MSVLPLVLAALASQDAGQRWNPGRVEFEGPLEHVRFDQGARGATEVVIELLEGERRVLEVPFAHRPLDPDAVPVAGAGARFEGWSRPDAWAGLPAGLRVRSRPIPPAAAGGAPGSGARVVTLLALLACGAVVLGARRRPLLALVLGAVGAGGAGAIELARAPGATPALRVLEALPGAQGGAQTEWLAVTAASGRLLAIDPAVVRVETDPAGAPLVYELRAVPGSAAAVSAHAAGARVCAFAPLDVRGRRLLAELNAWGPIDAVWTRTPAGIWTAREAWGLGEALPPARRGGGEPPGWAAAGLPQGVGVLVARLAPDAWGAGGPNVAETWIRIVGF